ncbi:hypothetical protein KC349_g249 [Hortaea werneckii]|nr:hypothetical protein KC349_g249 [Hortaea werneckii]
MLDRNERESSQHVECINACTVYLANVNYLTTASSRTRLNPIDEFPRPFAQIVQKGLFSPPPDAGQLHSCHNPAGAKNAKPRYGTKKPHINSLVTETMDSLSAKLLMERSQDPSMPARRSYDTAIKTVSRQRQSRRLQVAGWLLFCRRPLTPSSLTSCPSADCSESCLTGAVVSVAGDEGGVGGGELGTIGRDDGEGGGVGGDTEILNFTIDSAFSKADTIGPATSTPPLAVPAGLLADGRSSGLVTSAHGVLRAFSTPSRSRETALLKLCTSGSIQSIRSIPCVAEIFLGFDKSTGCAQYPASQTLDLEEGQAGVEVDPLTNVIGQVIVGVGRELGGLGLCFPGIRGEVEGVKT